MCVNLEWKSYTCWNSSQEHLRKTELKQESNLSLCDIGALLWQMSFWRYWPRQLTSASVIYSEIIQLRAKFNFDISMLSTRIYPSDSEIIRHQNLNRFTLNLFPDITTLNTHELRLLLWATVTPYLIGQSIAPTMQRHKFDFYRRNLSPAWILRCVLFPLEIKTRLPYRGNSYNYKIGTEHYLLHNLQLSWQWADIHVGWVAQNPFLAQLLQFLESARFLQPEVNIEIVNMIIWWWW